MSDRQRPAVGFQNAAMVPDQRFDGLPETSDDACYRAMDWLHDVREQLEAGVFRQVANLLNLEVDLLFFEPTATPNGTSPPPPR